MQSRTGNWMIAIGAIVAVIGLSVMPAGFGQNSPDRNLLGLGATIFSMGTVFIAMGIYLKALSLKTPSGQKSAVPSNPGRPIRGACDRCQIEMPVIQCKVHQQHLCGKCLSEHYDFRACVYAPSTRRLTAKAMAARAR
jgi:hypothetical protein